MGGGGGGGHPKTKTNEADQASFFLFIFPYSLGGKWEIRGTEFWVVYISI